MPAFVKLFNKRSFDFGILLKRFRETSEHEIKEYTLKTGLSLALAVETKVTASKTGTARGRIIKEGEGDGS
jgi:hypothetical protein